MEHYVKLLEKEIKKSRFGSSPRSLYDPIYYMLRLGGKRMRPLFTLLSYAMYKSDVESVVRYAFAVEAFHNFTLIHDDIMDKAPLRRGKKTVHEKWNINTAILSGDVLLVKVYERFLELDGRKLKEVLPLFNACAAGVCEGQQSDMEFESRKTVSEAEYLKMIELKTAILLGFSLELGGVLANARVGDRNILRAFGINLGIAFQLKDDLLDVYGEKKKFGKRHGGDIISNKKTILLIKAMRVAKGEQLKGLQHWLSVKKFDKRKKVAAVTALYDTLGIREEVEKMIEEFKIKAIKCLDQLSVPKKTGELRQLLETLSIRQR